MEIDLASRPTSLGRQLALVSVRERGVGPDQLPWIGSDAEIFEAFYREHVEDLQRFIARRVGERERAADLTAEIFLAAIESARPALARPPSSRSASPAPSEPACRRSASSA